MVVPVIIQQTKEVDCIVQAGIRYCEKEIQSPKETGIVVIVMVLWLLGLKWCFDVCFDLGGFSWLLPLGYFLLPFFILAIS